MQYTEARSTRSEDEISAVEIIQFFSRNAKFIGLVAVGLSALAIALSLLQPKRYQKQLSLSVQPANIPVTSLSPMDVNRANTFAVGYLQNPQLEQITVQPKYNLETQKIDLNLQSSDANALTAANSKIISLLETRYQEPLGEALKAGLSANKTYLEKQRQIVAQFDRQIARIPPTNTAKLEALETERAKSVGNVATLEYDKGYLEQSLKNLADFTTTFISVQVVNESNIQPTSSPKQIAVIALLASLMAAVLAAIIREQVSHLQEQLAKHKIDSSADV